MADISEELLKKLNIDGSLSAKEFASMLLFDGNESDIKDIRSKFKRNFLDKFKSTLNDIKKEDIKRIFDPLNLSGLLKDPDSLRNEFKEYKDDLRKFLRKAKAELENEKNKTKKDADVDDDKSNTNKPKRSKGGIREQEEFLTEKAITVELGENTKKLLEGIFKKSTKENKEALESLGINLGKSIEESGSGTGNGSFLTDLIAGIIGGGLLLAFWDSHIRPFLEEKFDFMNKLKGTFNGIEKFIYTVLPKLALDLIGGLFRKLDDVVQVAKGGLSKLFGFGGRVAAEAGVEAAAKGASGIARGAVVAAEAGGKVATEAAVEGGGKVASAVASKTAGGLFGKLGGMFLKLAKGIPVIGALVNFGFAWDRFSKGDNIGGVVDVIGGLGSLMQLIPIPPVIAIGTGLSWGAIALNAFLDITSEGKTEQEKSESKGKNIMKWISAPFKWIAGLPWVKSILNFGEGIYTFTGGVISGNTTDTISGLKMLQNSFLSPLADVLLPIYESNTSTENKTGKKKFDWANIWKDFTSKMLKGILPDWIYNMVAPYIIGDGISSPQSAVIPTPKQNESVLKNKELSKDEQIEQLNRELSNVHAVAEELKKDIKITQNRSDLPKELKDLADKSNELKARIKNLKDNPDDAKSKTWPEDQLNDGEVDYTPKLTVGNNLIASFNPEDSFKVIASKQGGDFEKMMSNLTKEFQAVNNKLIDAISSGLNSMSNSNSIVNISNSAGNSGNPFTLNTDMVLRARKLYMDSPRALA
jgi:hypothetical protein